MTPLDRIPLTPFQRDIVSECITKGSGGLSAPMGSGKSLISLAVALVLSPNDPIMIVVSKTLIPSWEHEIIKFFGDSLPYVVLHGERLKHVAEWTLAEGTRLVITTSEFLTRAYRQYDLEKHFVYQQPNEYVGYTNIYYPPTRPLLSPDLVRDGPGTVYAREWGCLVVDEAHGYCNIVVDKCRCIASICARHRWLLSGTLFSEPKAENLLGYYVLLNHPENPGDIISMWRMMRRPDFAGLSNTLVVRKQNDQRDTPSYKVQRHIIETPMTSEEATVYQLCRDILRTVSDEMAQTENKERRRKYAAYLLAIITYLRQILVAPVIVLSSVALDVCRMEDGSRLSSMIMDKLHEAGLQAWLETPDALYSSRCRAVAEKLRQLERPRVLIFSAFRTSIRLLASCLGEYAPEWEQYELRADHSLAQKKRVLDAFEASQKGILFLTYQSGAQGLNLQHSDTVFLLDTLWSVTATVQAIARVARQGQMSQVVNVYSFVGNTAMEHSMLEKHVSKLEITADLMHGPTTKKYHVMRVKDVVKLVLDEENTKLCAKVACAVQKD